MEDSITEYKDMIIELGTNYGLNILFAIIILIIGLTIAGSAQRMVLGLCSKSKKIDHTLGAFFSSLARYVIIIFTILAVLDRFGVETASLIAILGAASLAIGLALQGTLSNVAAGVMLLIFRPFKVGDFIDAAGHAGTIKHLGLFVTEMATGDNVKIIIPNSQIWGSSIKNFSANSTRRVDMVIGIGYDDDIDKAITEIGSVIDGDDRAHKTPEPAMFVGELGASSVDIVVRVWTDAGNYWPLKAALTKNIKHRFDEKGISFP
ncbi:MAG: mechanosensitive ion channel [Kordiimonadaceae bacterium]|nr:mechanosensitive ion channel [Kordiimonadaceae bacterium]